MKKRKRKQNRRGFITAIVSAVAGAKLAGFSKAFRAEYEKKAKEYKAVGLKRPTTLTFTI